MKKNNLNKKYCKTQFTSNVELLKGSFKIHKNFDYKKLLLSRLTGKYL